ncbi:ISKra4 family transposase [Variovorax sp. J31P179]|uniref:ISKra4 family transposase n=1 Tax=Variovorax sp. J31P179 TaxID=3053508 RepID=UPI002575DFB4|nr:ISKra4 family transposase [Variovorax sp. J31P179]MDM0085644.1 ISKra4 family transposase [Variovorax sp. J31P179]
MHPEAIRRHVLDTAERLEAQLGPEQFTYDGGSQREIEASPEPAAPITVGLDGGYIRGRDRLPGANGCLEVIAGKSIPHEGAAKVFAFVHRIDRKPKRRLRAVLESQGILPRQHITFLCDGGDTVRELGAFLHPRSEHVLDWFHVAMRIEQLLQTARGWQGSEKENLLKGSERVKWFLWHGNAIRADETLYDLVEEVEGVLEQDRQAGRPPSVVLKKLDRALGEFATYVDNNAGAIVNYGERYRCGERIATGFVESAVNQVISKRFVKKQQIRWTPRGAHLLLQVRTQVLNDELRASFERWYPGFGAQDQAPLAA